MISFSNQAVSFSGMGLRSLVFVAALVAFAPIFGGEKLVVTEEQIEGEKRERGWPSARTHGWIRECLHEHVCEPWINGNLLKLVINLNLFILNRIKLA